MSLLHGQEGTENLPATWRLRRLYPWESSPRVMWQGIFMPKAHAPHAHVERHQHVKVHLAELTPVMLVTASLHSLTGLAKRRLKQASTCI